MTPSPELEPALRTALARAVAGVPERDLAAATEVLVARYRAVAAASAPILASRVHVVAYAAYRMPATTAAMGRVLGVVAGSGFTPETMLDLGGGTGAAAWAAADAFPTLREIAVLDQVADALALGRSLASDAPSEVLVAARFERGLIDALPGAAADLVTGSYVLSELDAARRSRLVEDARAAGESWPSPSPVRRMATSASSRCASSSSTLAGGCSARARTNLTALSHKATGATLLPGSAVRPSIVA